MVKKKKKEKKEEVSDEEIKNSKSKEKKTSKKEEPKEEIEILAQRMGIHPYRLDSIMHINELKKGYKISQKELKELYEKLY